MSSCLKRLKHIALFGKMHSARFTLAVAETIWCIALFWPGNTFDRPTYQLMALIASETVWGLLFGLTAIGQWAILFYGRYHNKLAILFAAWNAVLWWWVCTSMYLSIYPPPAAISGELALALASTGVFVRSGVTRPGRRFDD